MQVPINLKSRRIRQPILWKMLAYIILWASLSLGYQSSILAQSLDPGGGQISVFLPIVSTDKEPEPTPSGAISVEAPKAQARFALVNLQLGADASYEASGQITPRDACDIVGRNLVANYWFLECDSGARGWIDSRFVIVTGSTQNVPIIQVVVMVATASPAPLAPTALPIPTATLAPPPPTPNLTRGWRASFYNNTVLSGEPAVVDDLSDVNFNWGAGSPYSSINVDYFAARFERRFSLPRGYHRFELRADDGVRFWLNNQLLIDGWSNSDNNIYTTGAQLVDGVYDFRIEYFEGGGTAYLQFFYKYLGTNADWQATYYDNPNLSGAPILSQSEPSRSIPLEFNIGTSPPLYQPSIGNNWSARWQGDFFFWSGDYIFRAQATGGVRVYIDGLLILEGWSDSQKDINNIFRSVGQGDHTIRIEYYRQTAESSLRVWWSLTPTNQRPF